MQRSIGLVPQKIKSPVNMVTIAVPALILATHLYGKKNSSKG